MPGNGTLRVLFIGDVVGKPGRRALAAALPPLRAELQPDVVIANAENVAHGVGITRKTLDECQAAGVDFFTAGNHVWAKPEAYEILADPAAPLIRPGNYPAESPGSGSRVVDAGSYRLLVVNLNGQVFIGESFSSPFQEIERILERHRGDTIHGTMVDFHAEATSEKVAFGWYVDGRVSAVLGTHTHIPTADETILPGGTAYQTDVGMVGLRDSVIGVDKSTIIKKFLGGQGVSHEIPDHGVCVVNATLVTIDPLTHRAVAIARHRREVTV
ncbi:MAG: TIGR00282 family metallophosphoesterase [Patescibacteria group bacterium]